MGVSLSGIALSLVYGLWLGMVLLEGALRVSPYRLQVGGPGANCKAAALGRGWIGVGKALRLPSLRTARAVFPHTALRLEVSTSGLN